MSTDKSIPRLDKKVYFVRVTEEMYKATEKLAKDEQRSINMMHQILLGYALNHYPDGVGKPRTRSSE